VTFTTMSVDPLVLDANVLAYAVDINAPQHAASRALLEGASDPSVTLYVTSQILCELYSVIANPRAGWLRFPLQTATERK
jgi:predicted nucleic acid-binding protein